MLLRLRDRARDGPGPERRLPAEDERGDASEEHQSGHDAESTPARERGLARVQHPLEARRVLRSGCSA